MEPTPQEMAAQLRKPDGDFGLKVGEMMNHSNLHTNKFIFEQLQLAKEEHALEIGFGNGFFINELLAMYPGAFYSGIDYSDDMVKDASYRNMRFVNSGLVELQQASLEKIPYPDNYFDAVFTINTLYFWPKPVENAQEIMRVLKPGGKLFLGIRPKSTVVDFPFVEHGFKLYEPEDAEQLLQKAGYQDTQSLVQEDPPIIWNNEEMLLKSACVMGTK